MTFPVAAGIRHPSTNIAGPLRMHYGRLCQRITLYAPMLCNVTSNEDPTVALQLAVRSLDISNKATISHCRVINAFQQKYPGETALNASTITRLVQWFCGTRLVADRKGSGRASIAEMKVVAVETALQRSLMKLPSVYVSIITEFISLLNSDERYVWL
ncbi:DUF4817 domain-containing protein [Trichonephila clavipes]|nr:DUF4817 domain-containing protein [Trichonephila clavipes]